MTAVMAGNILNLIFNVFMGRAVSVTEFGVIILITNILYVDGTILNALAATVNHEVALNNKHDNSIVNMRSMYKGILKFALPLSIVWLIFVPFLSNYFHTPNTWVFFLFTPMILAYPYLAAGRGYFQGRFAFFTAAILLLLEPIIKLIAASILIFLGLHSIIYISLYIGSLTTSLIAIFLILRIKPSGKPAHRPFPKKFFFNAALAGASSMAFLSVDVIMAKHYLSPTLAGEYALLSLVGKMVFFLGTLLNIFTISIISRDLGEKKNTKVSFYLLMGGSLLLCALGFLGFGALKDFTMPLLFGQKAYTILPFLNSYIIAMILFTLSSILVSYHLAKKQFIFPILSIMSAPLLIIGISFFHSSIAEIVNVLLVVGVLTFVTLAIAHTKIDMFGSIQIKKLETLEETNI